MDAFTHAMVGSMLAQLPRTNNTNKQCTISWQKRAIIGASAALFPDIDYVLFFINPLDFLAYWHRAETHSLLLAPLWAWLIMKCWQRFTSWQLPTKPLYWLCLLAIISHPLLDSLTVYGTQWFAPISRYEVAFNVLFVVDAYFSAIVLCSLFLVIIVNHQTVKILALLPVCYLLVVINIKHHIEQNFSDDQQTITLLPQPFSPLYWQAISPTKHGFRQAYIKLANDPVSSWFSDKFGLMLQQEDYQTKGQLNWKTYRTLPLHPIMNENAIQVWQHAKFKAFRHFSAYPILYDYKHTTKQTCVWFSDLRYHWPNITPSFRYGMCKQNQGDIKIDWQVYRMKYFSEQQERLNKDR